MNKKVKIIISIALFVLALLVCYFAYSSLSADEKSQEQTLSGGASEKTGDGSAETDDTADDFQLAPDFTMQDAGGNTVNFKDLVGKPLVINFWASWCPPCIAELPIFNEVYQELGDDVTFVMVDLISDRETVAEGKAHISENNFKFPVYFDVDRDGASTYAITSIPTTYFVNADGYIVTGVVGGLDRDTLELGISKILD
jgi:thiol-disulfide isomerase/thioredoxin